MSYTKKEKHLLDIFLPKPEEISDYYWNSMHQIYYKLFKKQSH